MDSKLYPEISCTVESLDIDNISIERKSLQQPLVDFIQTKVRDRHEVRLNFICTHNSRRSHLAQIWAQALAAYYRVPQVFCYSGGTEATALFPAATRAIESAGFQLKKLNEGGNPVYCVKFSADAHPVIAFSKTHGDSFNPESGFAAVMTCSEADEGCPFIPGAEVRIPLPYEDPKRFDQSTEQAAKYRERSLEIATELKYIFSKINR
jgi:arsenate reductase (thioredoxin)